MMIYDLDIKYQLGRIGIKTNSGSVELHTDIHGSFTMNVRQPELSISNTFPKIENIDYSKAFSEIGIPQPYAAAQIWRNEAKQHAVEYIGNKAEEGDMLGFIERDVSISDVVEKESLPDSPQLNVDAVPKTPPSIAFRMGEVDIKLIRGEVKTGIVGRPVTIDHKMANVDVFMEQNPYISIKAVPKGKIVDKIV